VVTAVLNALSATVVAGGLGAVLLLVGMTVPWLAALCGVVFVLWLGTGLRRVAVSVEQLELRLEHDPPRLVLRGPFATRHHPLDEVVAIQLWCDCGTTKPEVDPHRDWVEVVLRNGSSLRLTPGAAVAPDAAIMLRELLEPFGVKVVDWGGNLVVGP
jgi:hypothetical protein